MDINCIYDCNYQINGKCTLTDLSNIKNISFDDNSQYCPYMKKKEKKNISEKSNFKF